MLNRRGRAFYSPLPLILFGYSTGVLQTYRLCPGGRDPHSPRHLVVFFMIALMSISRQWSGVKTLLKTPKKVFLLALSAVLIGGNWLLFIWAVNNHHMLEASWATLLTRWSIFCWG